MVRSNAAVCSPAIIVPHCPGRDSGSQQGQIHQEDKGGHRQSVPHSFGQLANVLSAPVRWEWTLGTVQEIFNNFIQTEICRLVAVIEAKVRLRADQLLYDLGA